ncbi:MAG: aminotransferase class V-fold PLP-dependent enzyme [Saprospiraceae bacterium]
MNDRRSFIRQTASMLGAFALHQNLVSAFPGIAAPELPSGSFDTQTEDDFWRQIRQAYAANPSIINLNNGGVSPTPRATLDAMDYYNRMCSEAPSYYMWRVLDQDREPLRENLAALAGVDPEEIAINRNSTEALNSVIFGLSLKAGDEVVLSRYDYPNMVNAWKQRELRDGIKLVWVDLELPSEDENYLTKAYTSKFTAKTKIVHITHIINWNGQILPARKIADAAHARGIEVLVDAAHSFAVLDYKIPDLGCDYFGTSLHKFLCAPYGTGMMWIRKEKIENVWPLLGNGEPHSTDIRKFESLGTRSFPTEMAIGYSLDLHNLIGSTRKRERLHYLKHYWMSRVQDVPNIKFYTSLNPNWSCAIGNFGFEGVKPGDIAEFLFNKYKIHTVSIEWEDVKGVRVTPNVYTTTAELDKLVRAIGEYASTKL